MNKLTTERDSLVALLKTLIAGYASRSAGLKPDEGGLEFDVLIYKLQIFLRDEFGVNVDSEGRPE